MNLEKKCGIALVFFLLANLQGVDGAAPSDPRTTAERLNYFDLSVIINLPAAATRNARRDDMADALGTHNYAFVYYALPPSTLSDSFKEFLQSAEKTRVDQQIGSSASAGGSTSTASKTGLATLLGFALESGAVTQTIDQNVATLRANADGLVRFLSNQELFPACDRKSPECSAPGPLKDVELSVSFNVNDAGTRTLSGVAPASGNPVDFAALLSKHQFSAATARYAINNNRDPRSKKYRDKWMAWFKANQSLLQAAGRDLLSYVAALHLKAQQTDINGVPTATSGLPDQYTLWLADTQKLLAAAPLIEAEWQKVMASQLDILLDKMRKLDPEFDSKLTDLARGYVRYLALRRDLSSTLITDPALTVEYTYSQPTIQPKLHTVKVAYAYSPAGAAGMPNPGTITFNAALDFYQKPQLTGTLQNSSRWKDAQAALQFDRPLGPPDSPAQLSLGAYYQYQIHPGIITIPDGATVLPGTNITLPPSGTQLFTQKGSLFVGQATLTVRLSSSGLKVPIGISWSNRTDLVKGNEVRGHVGFTFDSTPLFLIPGFK